MKKETKQEKRTRAAAVVDALKKAYPDATCQLEYNGAGWKLLVMGRLSAQCTDARVNIVCRDLFSRFPTPQALAEASFEEVAQIIKPCGLWKSKTANLIDACSILVDRYNGILPDSMEELLKLPGVGRKIANLLLGDVYHQPAIVADTHCIRLCGRLGFVPQGEDNPAVVEATMKELIEPAEQTAFCHRLVFFGRDVCKARAPRCAECPLSPLCRMHQKPPA